MFMLIFFLIGASLMLALFPELSMAMTLLVPLVLVGLVRLALFWSSRNTKK
jgi:hypothetical protein